MTEQGPGRRGRTGPGDGGAAGPCPRNPTGGGPPDWVLGLSFPGRGGAGRGSERAVSTADSSPPASRPGLRGRVRPPRLLPRWTRDLGLRAAPRPQFPLSGRRLRNACGGRRGAQPVGRGFATSASANVGVGPPLEPRGETEARRGAGRGPTLAARAGRSPSQSHRPSCSGCRRNGEGFGGPRSREPGPRGRACARRGGGSLRRGGGAPSPWQPGAVSLATVSTATARAPRPIAPRARAGRPPRPTWSPKKAECSRLSSPQSPMEPRPPRPAAPRPRPPGRGRHGRDAVRLRRGPAGRAGPGAGGAQPGWERGARGPEEAAAVGRGRRGAGGLVGPHSHPPAAPAPTPTKPRLCRAPCESRRSPARGRRTRGRGRPGRPRNQRRRGGGSTDPTRPPAPGHEEASAQGGREAGAPCAGSRGPGGLGAPGAPRRQRAGRGGGRRAGRGGKGAREPLLRQQSSSRKRRGRGLGPASR